MGSWAQNFIHSFRLGYLAGYNSAETGDDENENTT